MALVHKLIQSLYFPFCAYNKVLEFLKLQSPQNLRVLIYHDISPEEENNFENQILWLKKSWKFVSADDFIAMKSGQKPIVGNNLLLTFDDGFFSNRIVAEKYLNPLGIKALFFIISDFVAIEDVKKSKEFISKNIFPGESISNISSHMRNMTWKDVDFLYKSGHTIGAHTQTHARLSDINETDFLNKEIIYSAESLESRLGIKINHFAFPFGNLKSFNSAALQVSRRKFAYIHTGLRGNNKVNTPHWAIRRDAIQPTDTSSLMGGFLLGLADWGYKKDLFEYQKMNSEK